MSEKDMSEIQEVRDDVAALRDQAGKFGKRLDMVDSNLELLDDLDKNIKDIQKEQRDNVKRLSLCPHGC